jgi:synaptic vesicle membrane protein VAT-1
MGRKGFYPDGPKLPACYGYEVSGIIHDIGTKITKFKKGDQVVALTRFDSQAEYCIVEEAFVLRKPTQLSFIDAASLPVVYITAWMLLVQVGGIKKDDTVLIQNAGGGVGLAAIDICRKYGAKCIGTGKSIS